MKYGLLRSPAPIPSPHIQQVSLTLQQRDIRKCSRSPIHPSYKPRQCCHPRLRFSKNSPPPHIATSTATTNRASTSSQQATSSTATGAQDLVGLEQLSRAYIGHSACDYWASRRNRCWSTAPASRVSRFGSVRLIHTDISSPPTDRQTNLHN